MSTYSPNGYIAALNMRTSRTLLVEGPSDKVAVSRIMLEVAKTQTVNAIVIDDARIIKSDGQVLGNREKIENVCTLANSNNVQIAALVDREYRRFTIGTEIVDDLPGHHSTPPLCFWTRGHSVENYVFTFNTIYHVLLQRCVEHLPVGCSTIIERHFQVLVDTGAAFALAAHDAELLSSSQSLINIQHWDIGGHGEPRLNISSVQADLIARSADSAAIATFIRQYSYYSALLQNTSIDCRRWVCHGHFGITVIRTGVARLLIEMGTTQTGAHEIAHGHSDDFWRAACDVWVMNAINDHEQAPQHLVSWLVS